MGTFHLTADNMFLLGLNEMEMSAREINVDLLSRGFSQSDLRGVAIIGLNNDSKYNELSVNGVVIRGQQLKDLASDLFKCRLHVNRQGYCYLFVGPGTFRLDAFGIVRYRLNDLFGWSKYGVVPSVNMIWDKCDLYTRRPVINLTEQSKLLEDYKLKLKDYKSQMKEKDQELYLFKKRLEDKDQDYKSQMKEKNQELTDYKLKLSVAEKELIRSEIHLEEKNKELKVQTKENELSTIVDKLLKEKDDMLKEYESQLNEKEKELSLSKNLSDKAKVVEELQLRLQNKKSELEEKDKELSLCKDKNRVNALKVTVISLVDSLYHLKMSLQQGQHLSLPTTPNSGVDDVTSSYQDVPPQGYKGGNLAQMIKELLGF